MTAMKHSNRATTGSHGSTRFHSIRRIDARKTKVGLAWPLEQDLRLPGEDELMRACSEILTRQFVVRRAVGCFASLQHKALRGEHFQMTSHAIRIAWLLVGLLVCAGCQPTDAISSSDPSQGFGGDDGSEIPGFSVLRLASTTSTRDSGLFEVLLPTFEQTHNCRVDLIAVGTGKALSLGEAGDVDVMMCHARSAEEAFMAAGHGVRHEPVMHSSFLIVGPTDDPAAIRGAQPSEAFGKIAEGQHRFVSRGDDSGTHTRELKLWENVGGRPTWDKYVETGQGMGPTLIVADELNAYLLIDIGTWLKRRDRLQLTALVTEGEGLENPYAVMVVRPDKHPAIKGNMAHLFADFLISEPVQTVIAEYTINGTRPFHPDRLELESVE